MRNLRSPIINAYNRLIEYEPQIGKSINKTTNEPNKQNCKSSRLIPIRFFI